MKNLKKVSLQDLSDVLVGQRLAEYETTSAVHRELFQASVGSLFSDLERPNFQEKIEAYQQNVLLVTELLHSICNEIKQRVAA